MNPALRMHHLAAGLLLGARVSPDACSVISVNVIDTNVNLVYVFGMDPGRLAYEITDRVGHAHVLLCDAVDQVIGPRGISRSEGIALAVLDAFPQGLSQAEWSRLQGVTRQRGHALVHRLDDQGLIVLEPLGREVRVALSPVGRRLVRSLEPRTESRLTAATARLSLREKRELHVLLGKLIASLEHDAAP